MNPQFTRARFPAPLFLLFSAWATASACNCKGNPSDEVGTARVLASCSTDCERIARVVLSVSPGEGGSFAPLVSDLAASGQDWSGRITGIPAGKKRKFEAVAFASDGTRIQSGSSSADIVSGAVVPVSISLVPSEPGGGGNHPPLIDAISVSKNPVSPAETVTVTVTARDPDLGDGLTFLWSSPCGGFQDPLRSSTSWTAPAVTGSCVLSVTVSDTHAASVSTSITVVVAVSGATVTATVNNWPLITSFSANIVLGPTLSGDLTVSAVDSDGDPLGYAWSTGCSGLVFDFLAPASVTHPRFSAPGSTGNCTVTVVVSDGRGGQSQSSLTLPPTVTVDRCLGVTCRPGESCDPADGVCKVRDLCSGVVCTPSDACHLAGECIRATGQCSPGSLKVCPAVDLCHQAGVCVLPSGQCDPGPVKSCGAGQSCDPADGQCKAASLTPFAARSAPLNNLAGLAVGVDGASYFSGYLVGGPRSFGGGISLTSAGGSDLVVGKYDASGTILWARAYGDAADQQPAGTAVSSSVVAVIGQFSGTLGPLTNSGATPVDFVLGLDPASGNLGWGRSYDLGLGGNLSAVAADPTQGLIAICGKAVQAATQLVPGATFGGATDLVIAVFNSSGALQWSRQVGTTNNEECTALAIESGGNVLAAGRYDGAGTVLGFTGTPLPEPGNSFRKHLWLARFNGATGAALAQTSLGSGNGSHLVNAIVVDPAGNVLLVGLFTSTIPFGTFTPGSACNATVPGCLVSAGSTDAFVARLDASFNVLWATRLGGGSADEGRAVGVDSKGTVALTGLINGATTSTSVTPTTVAPVPVSALAAPGAGLSAAFLVQLSAASGTFAASSAAVYGNASNGVNGNRLVVNRQGSGAVKDLLVFAGEYAGTLAFGGTSTPITAAAGNNEDFIVLAR